MPDRRDDLLDVLAQCDARRDDLLDVLAPFRAFVRAFGQSKGAAVTDPLPTREQIVAAIARQYDGEEDELLAAFANAGGGNLATEQDEERQRLIAAINKAYGYDPDTEGMGEDERARFAAFAGAIDNAFPSAEGASE